MSGFFSSYFCPTYKQIKLHLCLHYRNGHNHALSNTLVRITNVILFLVFYILVHICMLVSQRGQEFLGCLKVRVKGLLNLTRKTREMLVITFFHFILSNALSLHLASVMPVWSDCYPFYWGCINFLNEIHPQMSNKGRGEKLWTGRLKEDSLASQTRDSFLRMS